MRTSAATVLALALAAGGLPVVAQDVVAPESDASAAETEDLFDAGDLDALLAPVALYPDSLLTQVMVASTFPLDVVKADRLIDETPDATAEQRADAVEAEDWDPSVQVLASGFPTVIGRMADEVDWTEQLGDAVLAQTDDVLESIQRLRAQASATGFLASNEAQVVEVVDDSIAIAPADPEVVYVPSYDPAMAYTAAPTAAPVVVSDPGLSTSDLLTTGAIAFGSAFLVNELFEDDDDWDDYWGGPSHIDWDEGDFNARPDINVDGDVNINRGRFAGAEGGDRVNVNRERDIDRDRIGGLDGDALHEARDKGWKPSEQQQAAARGKIADHKAGRAARPGGAGIDPDRASAARDNLKAKSGGGQGDAREKIERAAAKRPPAGAAHRPETALKPRAASAPEVREARARAEAHKAAPRPKAAAKHKAQRPQAAKRPTAKHAPKKQTAFKKGGGKPKAASARGKHSKSKKAKRR